MSNRICPVPGIPISSTSDTASALPISPSGRNCSGPSGAWIRNHPGACQGTQRAVRIRARDARAFSKRSLQTAISPCCFRAPAATRRFSHRPSRNVLRRSPEQARVLGTPSHPSRPTWFSSSPVRNHHWDRSAGHWRCRMGGHHHAAVRTGPTPCHSGLGELSSTRSISLVREWSVRTVDASRRQSCRISERGRSRSGRAAQVGTSVRTPLCRRMKRPGRLSVHGKSAPLAGQPTSALWQSRLLRPPRCIAPRDRRWGAGSGAPGTRRLPWTSTVSRWRRSRHKDTETWLRRNRSRPPAA